LNFTESDCEATTRDRINESSYKLSSLDIVNLTYISNIPNSLSLDNQLNISQCELNDSDYEANTQNQNEASLGGVKVKVKDTKVIRIRGSKLVRLLGSQIKTPFVENQYDTLTTDTNNTNNTHKLEECKSS